MAPPIHLEVLQGFAMPSSLHVESGRHVARHDAPHAHGEFRRMLGRSSAPWPIERLGIFPREGSWGWTLGCGWGWGMK